MQPEYDFSKAKRARNVSHLTKLRASMRGKARKTQRGVRLKKLRSE